MTEEPVETPARAAAIDVAKDSAMVCTRLPHDTRAGRKIQRVWPVSAHYDDILTIAAMIVKLPTAAPACAGCGLVGGEHASGCAQGIIADLGTEVTSQFATAGHAAAGAKLVPLAHQSGQTARSGPTATRASARVIRSGS